MSVAIVGAGPGDPGLITVRGARARRGGEVLVYDRLVSPELVARATRSRTGSPATSLTQRGGQRPARHGTGARGLAVVRLKGGDPFVFGRGAEEADALAAAGVEFEVVPGVSTFTARSGARRDPAHRTAASPLR